MSEYLCSVCCKEDTQKETHCNDCNVFICEECFFDFDCESEDGLFDVDGDYIMLLTV